MQRHILALAGILLAVSSQGLAAETESPTPELVLGGGEHRYRWVTDWMQLPPDQVLGNTHGGIVIDGEGNVYFNTDTENAIVVLAPDGAILRTFGAEFAGGLHGMQLVREGDEEFLYIAHIGRHEFCKLTLEGEVLWREGYPEEAGIYENGERFRPTGIAVAPNGDLYVADGYGLSWVHRYDKERNYLSSFGGPGSEPGKLRCPHGIWIDTRGETPVVLVADRENHRLQAFALDGTFLAAYEGDLRRPCTVHQRGEDLVVADLAGRVTILDRENRLVQHLGDNPDEKLRARNDVQRELWSRGLFLSPHSAAWDDEGNLYVMDWNFLGRINKLARLPDEG